MDGQDHHERLHKLLRGERAAVDSYEKAIGDLREDSLRELLAAVLDDHRRATNVLSRHLDRLGETPDETAGPWGAFARAIETAGAWIDDAHMLKALKEGEVHGADEYRTSLATGSLTAELSVIVEEELLPKQHEHIQQLDRVIARLEEPDNRKHLSDRVEKERAGR